MLLFFSESNFRNPKLIGNQFNNVVNFFKRKLNKNYSKGGELMLKVNRNLKLYRIMAGLTQLELARRLGVKERVITFWETGRSEPHIEQVVDIAKVL